jgi:hypothetical protein
MTLGILPTERATCRSTWCTRLVGGVLNVHLVRYVMKQVSAQ